MKNKGIRSILVPVLALAALTGVLLVPSCKKDCKSADCFDRKTMLTDIGNKVIVPSFVEFATASTQLETEAQAFCAAPDIAGLEIVQQRWKETAYAIKKIELFQEGPVKNALLYPMIDFWPVRTNDVNNYLANSTTITKQDLNSKGSTVKGSPVIEYLIFDKTGGNSAVLDRFTTAADASKRKDYLLALTDLLQDHAQQLSAEWSGTYLSTFTQNDGTGISSSSNSLVNELFALEDYIKGMKVGAPAGKKDGNLYPMNVEAYYSSESMAFIRVNLDILEACFKGGDGQGFDDYLDFTEAELDGVALSKVISDQFGVCRSKCDAVTMPLSDAVSQQPAQVNELYTELQRLLVYLKVDMVNNLGITITLNDNDGD
ncbi:MAG: imelysin family protein [Bacteroidia bacterium]|nr:imelysin family protein [Bacteroidia bacterium]